jgi:hypothetical protein
VLGEQGAPPVDVLTNLLLDRHSIKTQSIGALVHGNHVEKFVASRLTRSELHEQRFELTTGGDGLRQVADLALDGLESRSLLTGVPRGGPRLESGEHSVDDRHDDGRPEHVAGERCQHGVVEAIDRDFESVPTD